MKQKIETEPQDLHDENKMITNSYITNSRHH